MRQRKTHLDAEIRHWVSAIAVLGHSRALLDEMGCKESELQAITEGLLAASPESIESRIEEIRTFVTNGLDNLREVLRKDTALARTEILKHTSEITTTPKRARKAPLLRCGRELGFVGMRFGVGSWTPVCKLASTDGCGGQI